jgi:hypothetical protein
MSLWQPNKYVDKDNKRVFWVYKLKLNNKWYELLRD